ncbi:hypothetical protein ACIBF6_38655 [Streptosporangium amethystogenes]|uniref:hypothetical protein n=1 Tax=Streptosporangium amethystogenes TaxID=2002 RepID=UPI00378D8960
MIKKGPLRFGLGRAWRFWLTLVPGVALILTVGVQLVGHDDPKKTSRSVTTPTEEDDASNAKIIDKEQRIDIDTFDQKDSPLWPLIEELRNAARQGDSTATDSKKEK